MTTQYIGKIMESYQHFNVDERTCIQVFLQALKGQAVESVYLDNGSEFAEHGKLHSELGS